jgi:hypothetical protein
MAAHGCLGNAVVREDGGLPLGGSGPVATHGGEEEGPHAGAVPVIDNGTDYGGKIRNPAAADPDGDACAGLQAGGERGTGKLAANIAGYVADGAIGKFLADYQQPGKTHVTIITGEGRSVACRTAPSSKREQQWIEIGGLPGAVRMAPSHLWIVSGAGDESRLNLVMVLPARLV